MEFNSIRRKSDQLGLSFPYDWSNPNISDDALILNVLERGIYLDYCKVAAQYGLPAIERQIIHLSDEVSASASFTRMLNNLKIGFSRA